MPFNVYVLPVKFSASMLESISAQIEKSKDVAIVSDATEALAILTNLHQPRRLERELRLLKLTASVIVYKYQDLIYLSEGPLSQLTRERAWCLYQPQLALENCGNTDIQRSADAESAPPVERPLAPVEDLPSGRSHEEIRKAEPSANISRQGRAVPLLRHDSTADPSSEHYSQQLASKGNAKYSCQRKSPLVPMNKGVVDAFDRMRLARTLQDDFIGVRAYSTAIASLKAYDHQIEAAAEIVGLEGVGPKYVNMIQEFLNTGKIVEIDATWADGDLNILLEFWQVHAVGAHTAREWFYDKGYRHLNDAIQSWDSWSRSIQIGLKFYDDFLCTIARKEVEQIAEIIAEAYQAIADETATLGTHTKVSFVVCGGFRRGKEQSSDVDFVCTHDSHYSHETLLKLLDRLHDQGHVQEVITTQNEVVSSDNPQFGISTALVVFTSPDSDRRVRRRVDILLTRPASYATCILGWSGSRTFVRDLRRYCSNVKAIKFDSSAMTSETDGHIILKESTWWTANADPVELEKRLFEVLELTWIPPELRNAD